MCVRKCGCACIARAVLLSKRAMYFICIKEPYIIMIRLFNPKSRDRSNRFLPPSPFFFVCCVSRFLDLCPPKSFITSLIHTNKSNLFSQKEPCKSRFGRLGEIETHTSLSSSVGPIVRRNLKCSFSPEPRVFRVALLCSITCVLTVHILSVRAM